MAQRSLCSPQWLHSLYYLGGTNLHGAVARRTKCAWAHQPPRQLGAKIGLCPMAQRLMSSMQPGPGLPLALSGRPQRPRALRLTRQIPRGISESLASLPLTECHGHGADHSVPVARAMCELARGAEAAEQAVAGRHVPASRCPPAGPPPLVSLFVFQLPLAA